MRYHLYFRRLENTLPALKLVADAVREIELDDQQFSDTTLVLCVVRQEQTDQWHAIRLDFERYNNKQRICSEFLKALRPYLRTSSRSHEEFSTRKDYFHSKVNLFHVEDEVEVIASCKMCRLADKVDKHV